MKLLREYIRGLLTEASEYDDQFERLMDSGYEGMLQAIQLADSLGIPSQELPWNIRRVNRWVDERGYREIGFGYGRPENLKILLEPTGWTIEKRRAENEKTFRRVEAEMKKAADEYYANNPEARAPAEEFYDRNPDLDPPWTVSPEEDSK